MVYLNQKVDNTQSRKDNVDRTNEKRSKNKQGMLSKRKSSTNKEDQQFYEASDAPDRVPSNIAEFKDETVQDEEIKEGEDMAQLAQETET